jgi:hypothetical protein
MLLKKLRVRKIKNDIFHSIFQLSFAFILSDYEQLSVCKPNPLALTATSLQNA